MRKFFFFLTVLIIAVSCNDKQVSGKKGITDDLGNKVLIDGKVNSAVSLAPNLTEIVFFIGAENRLAADTKYCDYPPAAKKKTKIGDMLSVDYEKLLSISPDIVLMTIEGNQKAQYEKIKSLGFNVFVSNPRNFNGILKTILDFGKIFGKEDVAERKTDSLKNELEKISPKKNERGKKETALFLISVKPLMAAGKNTFINEYLKYAGFANAVADSKVPYPVINAEELFGRSPDLIVLPENMLSLFNELVEDNKILKDVSAVKNKQIITIKPSLYFRPGPRFVKALEDFIARAEGSDK